MMSAVELIPDMFAGEDQNYDNVFFISLARAFLYADGDTKVAIARAMLSLLNN